MFVLTSTDHSVAVEKGGCFPGWARVTVAGRGQRPLFSLLPGDKVLALSGTGQVIFTPVILFLHQEAGSWGTFISLETEDGHRLALTPHHLLFTAPHRRVPCTNYQAHFSNKAKVGDYVLIHKMGGHVAPSKIISVSVVQSMGVYAPLTEEGTLFVNDILASSYALVENHRLAHWAFGPMRTFFTLNQLLWRETSITYNTTDTKTVNTEALQIKTFRGKQTPQNAPLGRKWKCPIYREGSTVHWYAQLLYNFGYMILDLNLFHH